MSKHCENCEHRLPPPFYGDEVVIYTCPRCRYEKLVRVERQEPDHYLASY